MSARGMCGAPVTDPEARSRTRFVFSSAHRLGPDYQGRLELPAGLIEYGGISKPVALVGAGGYLEVWDVDLWQEEIGRVLGRRRRVDEAVASHGTAKPMGNGQGEDAAPGAHAPGQVRG